MLSSSARSFCTAHAVKRRVIFTGPSIKETYKQALQKLNIGLAGHVIGGSLMLLSSSFVGANPVPAAIFGGLLWMQVMSTAKMTELGSWVNLCKNVTRIERVEDTEGQTLGERERIVITTDGSKISVETELKARAVAESVDDETALPTLKELKDLGVIHINSEALEAADMFCKELFNRDDVIVTSNETSKLIFPPPPGASNVSIPKLSEIYKKRQRALRGDNQRLASMIANAPPVDPQRMIEKLGTASMAMGTAVLFLGGGLYLASSSEGYQRSFRRSESEKL
jgi:hypothetical protein